jgi:MerR family copper efflux transcriptional regulator
MGGLMSRSTEEIMRKRNKREAAVVKLLTIGKVAKLSGVGVETIRFYEREGVLPKSKRKASGYRVFDPDTVHQIQFIRKVQEVGGFSLKDAGEIASGKRISASLIQIDRRIRELKDLQRELRLQLRPNGK